MIDEGDMAHCVAAIRQGSRSFHAASKLLPRRLRDPALALYAFCRLADDAVDLQQQKTAAVLRLHERLDLAYRGRPRNAPADRAFAAVIEEFEMPRRLPEALLEGLAWDAEGRRYDDLSGLRSYSARVASAVGAMMCVLMRERRREALARACDLGVAMQLTNIARDVGEDAREGRFYLPLEWMREARLDPARFLAAPAMSSDLGELVARLLREADTLYHRAEAGIAALAVDCRPGIYAARLIYAGIGGALRRAGHDPIRARAHTSARQKLGWLAWAGVRTGASLVMPHSALYYARPLPETVFLVEAAAEEAEPARDWSDTLHATLAELKARDAARRDALMRDTAPAMTAG
ncbi:MAG: phytoene synthase [Roseovarius sp.]|nr:phytoene synthase [Roseovarius sp.]MBK45786.1 phytoene synthase [Roseovarius sp.]